MGAGLELEVFFSRFSRDRVTRGETVFDVEISGFADVPHDLVTSVALGYTAGQCRRGGDVSAICFRLEDHRVAHRVWPLISIIPANTPGWRLPCLHGRPADVTGVSLRGAPEEGRSHGWADFRGRNPVMPITVRNPCHRPPPTPRQMPSSRPTWVITVIRAVSSPMPGASLDSFRMALRRGRRVPFEPKKGVAPAGAHPQSSRSWELCGAPRGHRSAQNSVDAGRIAAPVLLQPDQHIAVQPHRD